MTQSTQDQSVLLFVCHANICRSPMAEYLARLALANQPHLREARLSAASAGTNATQGEPIHPGAARVLRKLKVDCTEFRSRALSVKLVADARVVLAATRQERAICAALSPPTVGRIFTIRQFGRLAAALDPACLGGVHPSRRLAAMLDEVRKVRCRLQPVPADQDDLADPVHGTAKDMRACMQQIQQSLHPVLALIEMT
jgi:protein-tyrosine phosphatase